MKRVWALAAMGLLAFGSSAQAAEEPNFVSATFQDILARVVRRDKDSQAIVTVKRKADAPQSGTLNFSIVQVPHDENEAVVTLSINLKAGDGVYEKYRLKIDEAIRRELNNQKRMADLERERLVKEFEQRKKNIVELSGGTLREGMTLEEVVKVKGQPKQIEPIVYGGAMARLPEFKAIYADMEIIFQGAVSKKNELFSIKSRLKE
jgi:hypothetical protein